MGSEQTIIYHNPRCGKSRLTLSLLRERGVEPKVVEYLKTPPSAAELRPESTVVRRTQVVRLFAVWLGSKRSLEATAEDIITTMHAHPTMAESIHEFVRDARRTGR